MRISRLLLVLIILSACGHHREAETSPVPVIGFLDYVEDATLAQAREGFMQALADSGYAEENRTLSVIYRNAQGDQPTLLQAADYLISQKPALIATNTTLSTINTVKRTSTVPVFMMVAPRPDIAKLTDEKGNAPGNLHGVYETLDYIDSSVAIIRELFPKAKVIGTLYNQGESQSSDALERLRSGCAKLGLLLEELPVTSSSESQLVTQALLNEKVDVFFALPDNIIFSSFEVIVRQCDAKKVPILTCEAGLVARGAVASYGADFYQWGYLSGQQAATFLHNPEAKLPPIEVKVRRKLINAEKAAVFGITVPPGFESLKK